MTHTLKVLSACQTPRIAAATSKSGKEEGKKAKNVAKKAAAASNFETGTKAGTAEGSPNPDSQSLAT
jgi:hypothetical protein